jgi:F-type H+-transporting ATPase subunit b
MVLAAMVLAAAGEPFFESPETWVAVAFVLFIVLAGRAIWRALAKMLDARAARIKAELDEAQRLREEAEALLAEYQRKQRDAKGEAEAIIAQARDEATRLRREAEENIRLTLERRERLALESIAQAQEKARMDVRNEAVDVAVAAARRILSEAIDEKTGRNLNDRAIAEVERSLQ